jgi:hypothetical protein
MRKNTISNHDHKEKEDNDIRKKKMKKETFVLCKEEKTLGESTVGWAKFWHIRVPFQSPFLALLKTNLKYEYLYYIENNFFFHFQFQVMMV